MKSRQNHRQNCKCVACAGFNPVKLVEAKIKENGFAVMSISDDMAYTVGMSKGAKGGVEFVCTGLGGGPSLSVFLAIRDNYDFVIDMITQAESQDSHIVVFQNILRYKASDGQSKMGPVTIVKISEENKRNNLTMHGKYYKHNNFSGWQALIPDAEGRAAFDEGYDVSLIQAQRPLFDSEK